MGVHSRLVNQLLRALPYPLSKEDFVNELRVIGADEATIAWLERLPNVTFNSAREVQDLLARQEGSAA